MNNSSPQTVVPDCVGCKAVDLRCGVVCSRGGVVEASVSSLRASLFLASASLKPLFECCQKSFQH